MPKFVIQEHHARSHHFDFRLERQGVFKSWAGPKGIPEEAGVKRLAVEVEDHTLQFGDFEGKARWEICILRSYTVDSLEQDAAGCRTFKKPQQNAVFLRKKGAYLTTDQKVVGSTPTGCAIDNKGLM